MNSSSFVDLGLIEPLLKVLVEQGYETPTPIQIETIPYILKGRDIIGCAQTGTGKTAAFALPIIQNLAAERKFPKAWGARVLVLTPTRELAAQIGDSFKTYGRYVRQNQAVIFGGVGQVPQVRSMAHGVDVLIATPGRLLDLINQGYVKLNGIEIFVLDEADRMLDMGFIRDIKKIIAKLPTKRQSLFFSATMPKEIISLSNSILTNPYEISVTPHSPTVDLVDQMVMFVNRDKKNDLLTKVLTDYGAEKTIVFTQTKHTANKVAAKLCEAGIGATAIHGNKSQGARTAALTDFKNGLTPVLVATDIAARGIDIDDITHVINFEIPDEPESYVHRIGRTARAGASGIAISFCEAAERDRMREIEKFIKREIDCIDDHPFHSQDAQNATGSMAKRPPRKINKPKKRGGGTKQMPQNKMIHRKNKGSGNKNRRK